jgi:hypothetical protein
MSPGATALPPYASLASADWTPQRTKSAPCGQSGTPHLAIREYPFDEYVVQLRGIPRKGYSRPFGGSRRLLRSRLPPYASLASADLAIHGYSLSTRMEHFPEGMGKVLLRAPNRSMVR